MSFFKRLRSFLRREKLDAELDDELQFHLDQRTQDFIDKGMTPREARYAARRAFGNVGSLKEETRDTWGFRLLETLWQDVRFGARILVRNPGFAVVAVLPMRFLKAVRSQVLAVDKDQPVASETAEARFTTFLFGVFAVVGLVLAGTGIYGVMAYGVSQRTHEIGIRVALGAQNGDVMRWVLLKGLKLVLVGVAAGVLGSVFLSRLVASQLYGVTSTDPLTFFGVAALLTVVALMACYIPARRAAKVDPMVALRHE